MTRSLLFVATEDWFVESHFKPMLRQAMEVGYKVHVASRPSGAHRRLERLGVATTELEIGRSSFSPVNVMRDRAALQRVIDKIQPDIVHAIALKPAALATLTTGPPLVLAVTGMGWLSTANDLRTRMIRRTARAMIATCIRRRRGVGLFENEHDARAILQNHAQPQVFIAPGAGVDAATLAPLPQPPEAKNDVIRVGIVARMIRSKGIDVAVAAIRKARARGASLELHLAGAPDPANPGSIPEEELASWPSCGGVRWHGRVENVMAFWSRMHIACLPSRGGEGLPRSLLEAAAHARPIVTTTVPGCSDLIRHGVDGLLVPPGDVNALADALTDLARDPARRIAMGAAARQRILDGYTEGHVQAVVSEAWTAAAGLPHRRRAP